MLHSNFLADMEVMCLVRTSKAATNMGVANAGKQWLIEVLCFYFTLVLGDRLVFLNARLRQAPNRSIFK